ncbi:MAG: DUF4176 domain-containing protein [Monoglobaceae bacterium]
MIDNLLPVGSVITLTEATKKIMIIGTGVKREEDDTLYDYVGVPFPEGYIDSEILLLFMHDDIERVDFLGYINSEVQFYRNQLKKFEKD